MNLTALQASARRKVSPTITSIDYPDADLNADLNEWYRTILGWVMLESGNWTFKGNMAKTDFIINQNEYVLPSNLIFLNRVEAKYPNSTSFVQVARTSDKSTHEAFQNGALTNSTPQIPLYRVFDNSIFVYPAPTATVTAGLAIELGEDVADLSASGDLPNLNPLVHKALAIGAAYNFCASNELPNKANQLWIQMFGRTTRSLEPSKEALKTQIEDLAAQRDKSERGRFVPRRTSYA